MNLEHLLQQSDSPEQHGVFGDPERRSNPEGPVIGDVSDESLLVRRCLEKDAAAWETLLVRYKRLIYSVTVRFGLGPEDRREVFQSVCLEILRSLPSLRNAPRLSGWIGTIAIRECCDFIRRRVRERDMFASDGASIEKSVPADALSIYYGVQRLQMVREAVDSLPERDRELVHNLFLADEPMNYVEAAGQLGVSPDSIGSMRQRSLQKLRNLLLSREV